MMRPLVLVGIICTSACNRAPPHDPCPDLVREFDTLAAAPCTADSDCAFGPAIAVQPPGQMGNPHPGPHPRAPTAAPRTSLARLDALAADFERLGCGRARRRPSTKHPSFDPICDATHHCTSRSTHGY